MSESAKLVLLLVLVGIFAMLAALRGCSGYGEVGPKAYEHAQALYSICNRRDAPRLEAFSASLEHAVSRGEVTSQEQKWLAEIVDQAQAGQWQEATSSTRRLMEDQIQNGP